MLLDSLFRQYPVSVLLFWRSAEDVRTRTNVVNSQRYGGINWVIDGQQRIRTLHNIFYAEENTKVVFNPHTLAFQLENPATQKDPNWYGVSSIFDDSSYRNIKRNLPENALGEKIEEQFDRLRSVMDYEIPVIYMEGHSFEEAVDAFKRVNTLGMKLKAEDMESAKIASKHGGFISEKVIPFLRSLHQKGFSRVNIMHLFKACEFIANYQEMGYTTLFNLSNSKINSAWKRTEKAFLETVALILNQFGLVKMDLLWSGALLIPVVAMYATRKGQDRDEKGITGWLAMAALLHRYSGATETALDQDLKAMNRDDYIGGLLSNIRKESGTFEAHYSHFSGSINDKGGVFAMYVACRHRGLTDLFSKTKLNVQSNIDRHHILPKAQFPQEQRYMADALANIAFITGDTNRQIGAASPDVYLGKIDAAILESQCISTNPQLWSIDKADSFWLERRKLLAKSFNEFLRERLPKRRIGA